MISRKPQRRESLYIDIHAIRANHLRSFVTSIEARVTGAGPAYGTILAMPVDAIGPTGKFAILAVGTSTAQYRRPKSTPITKNHSLNSQKRLTTPEQRADSPVY